MEKQAGDQAKDVELAKILGLPVELASSCLATGHITLMHDTWQTYMRLRDIYQVLRQRSDKRRLAATS
ncbi:MAG: hypothetical protein ACUVRZ_04995 [Desulfobacca sp.]|uniref:hypothetical protein n=1 Tax=Desulfobacca sp. TaxID=2067990 RepID=UPI00404A3639